MLVLIIAHIYLVHPDAEVGKRLGGEITANIRSIDVDKGTIIVPTIYLQIQNSRPELTFRLDPSSNLAPELFATILEKAKAPFLAQQIEYETSSR